MAPIDHDGSVEDDDFRLLEFEDAHPRNDHAKETSLRAEFGLTPAVYFQRLFALIEEPDVIATYPLVRRRLVRLRARQHQVRTTATD
ncbi:MAG: DUF3263 domain-containing protein [Actinomycetota bacterium]